jgi:hypothetical protein
MNGRVAAVLGVGPGLGCRRRIVAARAIAATASQYRQATDEQDLHNY